MFDQGFITSAINRSAENSSDRRNFLRAAGVAGFGVGAAMLATGSPALAAESTGPAAAGPSRAATASSVAERICGTSVSTARGVKAGLSARR